MAFDAVRSSDSYTTSLPGVKLEALHGKFGVALHGFDPTAKLSDAQIDEVSRLVQTHKVVVLPKTKLDDASQETFVRRFGKIIPHPTVPSLEGTEAILDVDGGRGQRASSWHTDFSFVDAYAKFTFLRGHVIPERGGDTLFADTASAYEELPAPLQRLADETWAVHSNLYDYARRENRTFADSEESKKQYDVFTHKVFQTEHPLVHVHPVTGKRTLILGHFIQKLVGYGNADSRRLLDIFHDHATSPENTLRWQWSVGDLVIWDDRQTLHRAVDDYGDQPRVVRRSTIWGDAPVSIDGRRSVPLINGIARSQAA
jgi:alpha-ketoglutarate-dependent sulfate ester dioxygenase